ncbi:MAG: pyridoxal phosphate-dependent aminotransferase [Hyphomicrobiales bacterium]|nr:pyridoxal phosphate-dependent aminotransferase [Hyphomicrobiales bacterium]
MVQRKGWISGAVSGVSLSVIKEMAMLSAKTEGAVSLAWGLPSFRTPEHIRAAVAEALKNDPDIGKYALPNGLPELRQRVARLHRAQTGVKVDADQHVLITAGNMQGMNSLFRAIIDPGDEVIVTDPGFASHIQQIRIHGGHPVHWVLDEGRGWQPDLDSLPALVTARTKAIVLVTPSNPTGAVFSKTDLVAIGEFALDQGILIFIDDPYSYLVYDDTDKCFNLASQQKCFEQLVYLFTFSKIHAMSGWRLGYMVLPDWLRGEVLKVHDATMICAPRISQVAGMAALGGNTEHMETFKSILATRRKLICERLDRIPHVYEYVKPDGAYYVFPRIVTPHQDSREFCLRLLNDARVAATPGIGFGPHGQHHVRLAYCVENDTIDAAFDRIEGLLPA